MDLGSLIGLVAGIIFVILTIMFGADMDFMAVGEFADAPSVMIVIGGTLASTLIAYPLSTVLKAFKAAKLIFMPPKFEHAEAISRIITLSNLARREGVLALEETAQNMDDPFLKKGVMLVVDGGDPELVRSVLETEMTFIENRHNSIASVWDMISASAPAWGMVGTMVGMVLLLGALDDMEALAANMAIVLITTFYGGLVANFLATPISNKLKAINAEEMLQKEVLIEGILSIQAGENPRIIEEKLKAFIAPALRNAEGSEGGE